MGLFQCLVGSKQCLAYKRTWMRFLCSLKSLDIYQSFLSLEKINKACRKSAVANEILIIYAKRWSHFNRTRKDEFHWKLAKVNFYKLTKASILNNDCRKISRLIKNNYIDLAEFRQSRQAAASTHSCSPVTQTLTFCFHFDSYLLALEKNLEKPRNVKTFSEQ